MPRSKAPKKQSSTRTIRQRVHSLDIHSVKYLRNVIIDFAPEHSMVTGIFGPNGCGKSTILHLLACCYQPTFNSSADNFKFSHFFLPTTNNLWQGSSLTMHCSHAETRRKQAPEEKTLEVRYEKRVDRWMPRYQSRPRRDCYYLGISTCVPRIENEKRLTRISFVTSGQQTGKAEEILKAARRILNRAYQTYDHHTTKKNTTYIGVSDRTHSYTELAMGAGEQRVFKILEAIHSAPKNALILIDEVDLLLHEQALIKLIEYLRDYCKKNAIQLVFTAHRPSILEVEGINQRHIIQTPGQTFCVHQATPDAVNQLVSKPVRPVVIYVEDDLAEAVMNKLLEQTKARRLATIHRFGSAQNAFTLAGAAALNGGLSESHIFILDGDIFRTDGEREKQMRKALSGDDPRLASVRDQALGHIKQFILPPDVAPEEHVWSILSRENPDAHFPNNREIIELSQQVYSVDDTHDYLNQIIQLAGYERSIGLLRIVDAFSSTLEWDDYTSEVRSWLEERIQAHSTQSRQPEADT